VSNTIRALAFFRGHKTATIDRRLEKLLAGLTQLGKLSYRVSKLCHLQGKDLKLLALLFFGKDEELFVFLFSEKRAIIVVKLVCQQG
jgi:hypothetical protein